ncbi:MAG: MerR family transcriptional regulator [Halioglobus sp.]|nr:MerR family transcriptional regulator [Halioglobus sp.]
MSEVQLESRPLYGIGTVARLTGVKPDTLRAWERRYQLGASCKSSSGRRQYTQGDLEHLQLVSALVAGGARIGEIAGAERRTLEQLLKARGPAAMEAVPDRKPRILFVGEGLCNWLDDHQGCLMHVDAILAPCAAHQLDRRILDQVGEISGLVAHCSEPVREGDEGGEVAAIGSLAKALNTENVIVLTAAVQTQGPLLQRAGFHCEDFPPDPVKLAFHLTRQLTEQAASPGEGALGDLVQARPRLFGESELREAAATKGTLACECPGHLSELVQALAEFEEYSTSCSVKNWEDASVHACVYAYTGQARWLIEKALQLVLEHRD